MRLAEREIAEIVAAVRELDEHARVFLFGSRVDDAKKGGDIDLLILSTHIGVSEKRKIRRTICDAIGDQRIDIVVASDTTAPLVRMAQRTGVLLE